MRFIVCGEQGGGPLRLDDLLSRWAPTPQAADAHRDDVAFWLYTSGSTGRRKAAMHTHAAMRLTANLYGLAVAGYRESDIVHSVSKQFFAYGLGNALSFPYAAGATAVLNKERPTPQAVTDLIKRHGVTVLNAIPTFFAGWFASGEAPSAKEASTLRMATSASTRAPGGGVSAPLWR